MIRLNIINNKMISRIFGDGNYENLTEESDKQCTTQEGANQSYGDGKISAWQAGWNITNAIQVKEKHILSSFNYSSSIYRIDNITVFNQELCVSWKGLLIRRRLLWLCSRNSKS